ncbi:MAG: MBL fold metallo-hydrolase [Treponema sp.]|jgi:phosphoribosyl 1,2-cyclic phosphodiesterase|nr:MBL fold metallo-hydrolase [Treponema sp.]
MLIRFWGVRGSLPSPILPSEVKAKIAAILEQMVPQDIADAASRERFLAGLPPWLYGTVGGNSPCITVDLEGFNEPLIFDCGSGMREMGIALNAENFVSSCYHIFFSHFHWDHLIGFPFFDPLYNASATINFYSPKPRLEEWLLEMMKVPYFPVQLENLTAQKNFNLLEKPVSIGPATVAFRKMNHPGDSFSYMINHKGKRFIYATDVELSPSDFLPTEENTGFFKDADVIVLDAQYTLDEAIDKYNWGHNAFSLAVDFAANWGIRHLILFHHDPTYDDRKLYGMLQSARWYHQQMGFREMEISLAVEELEISL